jgi:hypothetical protein
MFSGVYFVHHKTSPESHVALRVPLVKITKLMYTAISITRALLLLIVRTLTQ